MAANNLDAVSVEIKIAGEVCDYETMELFQSICAHHQFEIKVNYQPGTPSVWAKGPDAILNQLGEKISIVMTHNESGEKTSFEGLISDIDIQGCDGNQGYVILRGGSPTLLLDRNPAMDCYIDQTLNAIVGDAIDKCGVPVKLTNSPKHSGVIPYIARHKETCYGFLARLLRSYGEWFYYDGTKLLVGNPEIMTEAKIAYDVDLTDIVIKGSIHALNNSVYDFDMAGEGKFLYEQGGTPGGVTLGSKTADGCSKPLFPTEATLPSARTIHSGSDMQKYADSSYNRNYANLSNLVGTSRNCGIKLGELVSVSLPENISDASIMELGRYRVAEIKHTVNKEGHYHNTFKGIPTVSSMPMGDAVMPVAYPELAKVTNNDDPKKQGRVKVRFMWQESQGKESNWMPVQSPDAGKSDKVSKNRGFVFIPEKEDLVMIGYEQGNPDRPFVMGSIFYKENSKGAESGNKMKTITTRSGASISFDDDKGDGSITISDPSGNTIVLGGDKTITISAPESISLSAKTITINGEDSVEVISKKITGTADEKMDLSGGQSVEIKSDTELKESAPQISIEAQTAAGIKSTNVTVEGSATTTIKGSVGLNLN